MVMAAACTLGGCALSIGWSNHVSLRSKGDGVALGHVDADEAVKGAIRANLDYVSIALDSVFVRNLPGLTGRSVTLSLDIQGILPKGKSVRSVLGMQDSVGEHGFLSFDNVAVIEPFLYTGRNLTIRFELRAVPKDAVATVKGHIAGAQGLLKKLSVTNTEALEAGSDLFQTIVGATASKALSWKYQFTLFPADGVYRDKPEMLLTAARHILLIVPPADAPAEVRKLLRPSTLLKHLRLRGNRLVWRHDGQEFVETPYVVLNITRYRRYPSPETELRKVARDVDVHIERTNYQAARGLLAPLGEAIARDSVITVMEKNLERTLREVRELRIASEEASKLGQQREELEALARQARALRHVRSDFSRILYPYETKDFDFRVGQIERRAQTLAPSSEAEAKPVSAEVALYRANVERLNKLLAAPVKPLSSDESPGPPPRLPSWKRPHQKWWFWTLIGVGAAALGTAGYFAASRAGGGGETGIPTHVVPVGPRP